MRNTMYHDVWMVEMSIMTCLRAVDTEGHEINSCCNLISSVGHKEALLCEKLVMRGLDWNLK
jgi:hypothetical protein